MLIDHAQLHVFGRCGHWVQIEWAPVFNKLLAEWGRLVSSLAGAKGEERGRDTRSVVRAQGMIWTRGGVDFVLEHSSTGGVNDFRSEFVRLYDELSSLWMEDFEIYAILSEHMDEARMGRAFAVHTTRLGASAPSRLMAASSAKYCGRGGRCGGGRCCRGGSRRVLRVG